MTQQCKWIRVAEAISTPHGQDPEGIKVKINRARLGISDQPFIFPLEKRPVDSYKKGGQGAGSKWFGAPRDNGTRSHAGCDLMAPPGTPILAVKDGTVKTCKYFYNGTYALEVDHGDFVVRYGEIYGVSAALVKAEKVVQGENVYFFPECNSEVEVKGNLINEPVKGKCINDLDVVQENKVLQGEVIAYVGLLNSGQSMLHFEMYCGTELGTLSDKSSTDKNPLNKPPRPYYRRKDLIDPTPFLDGAVMHINVPKK